MNRFTRLLSLLMCTALLFTLLASCGDTEDDSKSGIGSADGKDTFVVALDSDIVKLDPAFAYDYTTNPVVNQITQSLLFYDENNQLQPLLASSWEQVDDVTYVYQIRDDVTFSDGTPMTMDDVIYSLERTSDPDGASYMSSMFTNVDTIEATGDWELTIKLREPDATWQYVLGTTAGHVVSKAFAEEAGDKFGTAEGGLLGTGPYKFVSWQNGTQIDLTRNENYWGEDAGYYDNLTFKIIAEDATRVSALQNGDIDCTVNPPESMLDSIKADENLSMTDAAGFGLTYLAFNTQKEPFNNADVRNAIYLALDLESMQENLIKDAGMAGTPLASSDALFTIEPERWTEYLGKLPAHTYDPDAAKELLSKAGYGDGFTCNVVINDSTLRNSMALAMQDQLSKVGITLNIDKVSGDEHTAYQFGDILAEDGLRNYDMIMAGWESDFPDPSSNMESLYLSGLTSNAADYNNPKVDKLLKEQKALSDPAARNDLMFQAYDIITKDTPYVFMYYPIKHIAMNKAYTGVTMNAAWSWNIQFQDAHPVDSGADTEAEG